MLAAPYIYGSLTFEKIGHRMVYLNLLINEKIMGD